MRIVFDPTGTLTGLRQAIAEVTRDEEPSLLVLLCCADNAFIPAETDPLLQQIALPLIGGIFPGIIHAGKDYDRGSLVIAIDRKAHVTTITSLDSDPEQLDLQLDAAIAHTTDTKTIIVFIDGFSTGIDHFIESLFNTFGLDFNYLGGGAGALTMARGPYILTNMGMQQNCAVLAFLELGSGIGVAHGWRELAGPYQVTEASNNLLHTIEWQNALDFYKKLLLQEADLTLDSDHFFKVAQNHPFGIARLGGEQIIRDPYAVLPDGSLACIGDIAEGAFLTIMQAENSQLIEAAEQALARARQAYQNPKPASLLFFVDCISRKLLLGEQFAKELAVVNRVSLPMVGICSIGEIANCGTEYLEFYNKTAVVALLE